MKAKLQKILDLLNGYSPTKGSPLEKAQTLLRALHDNFESEVGQAFASKGGSAGRGKAKTRSPEFYKELAAQGVAARQAIRLWVSAKARANLAAPQFSRVSVWRTNSQGWAIDPCDLDGAQVQHAIEFRDTKGEATKRAREIAQANGLEFFDLANADDTKTRKVYLTRKRAPSSRPVGDNS